MERIGDSGLPFSFTDIDGVISTVTVTGNMTVPTSCGPQFIIGNCDVEGFNGRPIEITAVHPATAYDNDVHFDIGYGAGCWDAARCTGIYAPTGGVYKTSYVQALYCSPAGSTNCYLSHVGFYDPVSVNDNPTYQMQRNGSPPNAIWRIWANDVLLEQYDDQMQSGRARLGVLSKNLTSYGLKLDCCPANHQKLNMNEQYFFGIYYHRFGQASTSPPGPSNYTVVQDMIPLNPHAANCSTAFFLVPVFGGPHVLGTGSC